MQDAETVLGVWPAAVFTPIRRNDVRASKRPGPTTLRSDEERDGQ